VNLSYEIYTSLMNDFSNYPRFQALLGKKILSIDFGSKVIGTAMFCPGRDPFPYAAEKIIYKSHEESVRILSKLMADEDIEVVVLGIPYFVDGKESSNTLAMKAFGETLKKAILGIAFFEQDETLTTKTAEERMKNSPEYNFKVDPTKIDCLSATIILEDFIRS
jgi:putative Holliday junction resolvase